MDSKKVSWEVEVVGERYLWSQTSWRRAETRARARREEGVKGHDWGRVIRYWLLGIGS